ncbi:hypothetical protein C8Q73DRAFT_225946 [Cubamyces lactineus]|nr:hypothetical protein C8Q73DRAFT_225946 [Cubamyces lactineus]
MNAQHPRMGFFLSIDEVINWYGAQNAPTWSAMKVALKKDVWMPLLTVNPHAEFLSARKVCQYLESGSVFQQREKHHRKRQEESRAFVESATAGERAISASNTNEPPKPPLAAIPVLRLLRWQQVRSGSTERPKTMVLKLLTSTSCLAGSSREGTTGLLHCLSLQLFLNFLRIFLHLRMHRDEYNVFLLSRIQSLSQFPLSYTLKSACFAHIASVQQGTVIFASFCQYSITTCADVADESYNTPATANNVYGVEVLPQAVPPSSILSQSPIFL